MRLTKPICCVVFLSAEGGLAGLNGISTGNSLTLLSRGHSHRYCSGKARNEMMCLSLFPYCHVCLCACAAVCARVCMCSCVCTRVHARLCVHACARMDACEDEHTSLDMCRGQRSVSVGFLSPSPAYHLKQELSLILELSISGGQLVNEYSRSLLCISLVLGSQACTEPACVEARDAHPRPHITQQTFPNCAISLVLILLFL